MPLSRETSGIAGFLEQLGDSDFRGSHEDATISGNEVVNSGSVGTTPRHESNTGRGADGGGGVAVGKADTTFRHGIEMRSFDVRVSVAFQVSIPEVIGEDDNDVGFRGRGACEQRKSENGENRNESTVKIHKLIA